MAPRARSAATARAALSYFGVGGALALYTLDEQLDLRRWRVARHHVSAPTLAAPLSLSLQARTRPPPIGAMDWPAGRVLLQLLLEGDGDDLPPVPPRGATVLEIGAGIGTAAIGLGLAVQADAHAQADAQAPYTRDVRVPARAQAHRHAHMACARTAHCSCTVLCMHGMFTGVMIAG